MPMSKSMSVKKYQKKQRMTVTPKRSCGKQDIQETDDEEENNFWLKRQSFENVQLLLKGFPSESDILE